jgi:serine/threonine protein phosphatase PrpC
VDGAIRHDQTRDEPAELAADPVEPRRNKPARILHQRGVMQPLSATQPLVPPNGSLTPQARAPLTVQSFGLTDAGRVRPTNEDQFVVATLMRALWIDQSSVPQAKVHYGSDRCHLFVVADGMGGAHGGERASAVAVGAIEGFLLNAVRWVLALDGSADASALNDFKAALREADASVYSAAVGDPNLQGMGTTLTLAYTAGSVLFVAHVGDSRCYLLRGGVLHQLTRDHTVVQELLEQGVVDPDDAAGHNLRHMITNVVGGHAPGIKTEVHRLTLEPGDTLLLCTDGLTNTVPADRIQSILAGTAAPEQACAELIRLANEAGGEDNATAIVARYA